MSNFPKKNIKAGLPSTIFNTFAYDSGGVFLLRFVSFRRAYVNRFAVVLNIK